MSYRTTSYRRIPVQSSDSLANLINVAIDNPEAVMKVGLAILAVAALGAFFRALLER